MAVTEESAPGWSTAWGPALPKCHSARMSDPPHMAVVIPIPSNKAHRPAGLMIAGISSRLAINEQYVGFLELLTGQIATAIVNARGYEEERRRAEALAELDRAKTAFLSRMSVMNFERRSP